MKRSLVTMLLFTAVLYLFNSFSAQANEDRKQLPSYLVESPDYIVEPPDVIRVSSSEAARKFGSFDYQAKYEATAIVGPDGFLELEDIGKINCAGLTPKKIRQAILDRCNQKNKSQLIQFKDLTVEVKQSNSKVVYLVHRSPHGDNVARMPLTARTTVQSLLKQAVWAHPVDLAASAIELRRASEDGEQKEKVTPIQWEADSTRQATAADQELQPGDRVFVREPEEAKPLPALQPLTPLNAKANLPVTSSQRQLIFHVQVVEDRGENLTGLGSLKNGFLAGDSDLIRGTLKILKENKIVRVLADPSVACLADQPANFKAGGEIQKDGAKKFVGTDMNLLWKPQSKKAVQVEFEGKVANEVDAIVIDTSFIVELGKTVVIGTPKTKSSYSETVEYYWVVTPEAMD